jgi:recombinational DNA repair protein (RecF pathway)
MGICVDRQPHGEHFFKLALLTADNGLLYCLRRVSRKQATSGLPDLFDDLSCNLECKGADGPCFVREDRVEKRRSGIAGGYRRLKGASLLATLSLKNARHIERLDSFYELVRTGLDAIDAGHSPEAVLLKALYRLTRDEGYPIREDWHKRLSEKAQTVATYTLKTPLKHISIDEQVIRDLRRSLEGWMIDETDFLL